MIELREITAIQRKTSALGFGCNNLLGDKTREQGVKLLHAAFDAGIRHFDVARYYNYGDAEGMLAEVTSPRRAEVTITTKFGMQPLKQLEKLKGVVQLARRITRSSTIIRKLVRRRIGAIVRHGQFDPESARVSLEASLRELKTDYIDIYLLHECGVEDCRDDILAFLRNARAQGKILTFGIGSEFPKARVILEARPEFCAVTQFDSDALTDHASQFAATPEQFIITHGSFAPAGQIRSRLAADDAFARSCNEKLGMNLSDPAVLGGLILQHALRDNPNGIVLFRSSRPETVRDNVRAAFETKHSNDLLDRFAAMAKELAATTPA